MEFKSKNNNIKLSFDYSEFSLTMIAKDGVHRLLLEREYLSKEAHRKALTPFLKEEKIVKHLFEFYSLVLKKQ